MKKATHAQQRVVLRLMQGATLVFTEDGDRRYQLIGPEGEHYGAVAEVTVKALLGQQMIEIVDPEGSPFSYRITDLGQNYLKGLARQYGIPFEKMIWQAENPC